MTSRSERNVALSRGKQMAAPASTSRVQALEHYGLRLEWLDDITVIVERQYLFNLAGSSWTRIDDPTVHGYLVASLVKDYREGNPEKPVAGRDSVAAHNRTSTAEEAAVAESAAGHPLLPEVWP